MAAKKDYSVASVIAIYFLLSSLLIWFFRHFLYALISLPSASFVFDERSIYYLYYLAVIIAVLASCPLGCRIAAALVKNKYKKEAGGKIVLVSAALYIVLTLGVLINNSLKRGKIDLDFFFGVAVFVVMNVLYYFFTRLYIGRNFLK